MSFARTTRPMSASRTSRRRGIPRGAVRLLPDRATMAPSRRSAAGNRTPLRAFGIRPWCRGGRETPVRRRPAGIPDAGVPPRGSTGNHGRPTVRSATAMRTDHGGPDWDRRPTSPNPAVRVAFRTGCRRGRLARIGWRSNGRADPTGQTTGGRTGPRGLATFEGRPVLDLHQLPAGGIRRIPTSRYEVAIGVLISCGGAPGSILTPAGPGRSAAASRQCAIIPRAVASGSSICGT